MKLSEHFSEAEFCKSETAVRRGIDNSLPPDLRPAAVNTCKKILEPVRAEYGAYRPNSGYRCPSLNRLLKSSSNSQHTKGEGVDFEIAGVSNRDLFDWCRKNLDFDQLILEFHDESDPTSGWVHGSTRRPTSKNRKQAFILKKGGEIEMVKD